MKRKGLPKIEWDACWKDLEAMFPKIEEELRLRLDEVISRKSPDIRIDYRISLEDRPPCIEIYFTTNISFMDNLAGILEEDIAPIIGEVSTTHDLRSYRGRYVHKGDKKRNISFWDGNAYVLKPYYDRYESMEQLKQGV